MTIAIDETGNKYGKLTVLSISDKKHKKGARQFNCICDCGNELVAEGQSLRNGNTLSCGCQRSISRSRHRDIKSKEYTCWALMKSRCSYKKGNNYQDYGGRGISVCDRWIASYENFLLDMGRAPSRSHSIDRIDVNGNYEPSNCRWATIEVQARNKRNTKYIPMLGNSYLISEFRILIGINKARYDYLKYKLKLTNEQIFKLHKP